MWEKAMMLNALGITYHYSIKKPTKGMKKKVTHFLLWA